jgi:CBS domain-containing protein
MRVRDIMRRKVVSIGAEDTLRILHDIMQIGNVRHLPVVRAGALVGVVSQRDLFHASLSSLIGIPSDEQNLFLEGVPISEVMSSPPVSVEPDTPLPEAARLMAERKIGCLPVVEDQKVVGIVTETDMLRLCADLLASREGGSGP